MSAVISHFFLRRCIVSLDFFIRFIILTQEQASKWITFLKSKNKLLI